MPISHSVVTRARMLIEEAVANLDLDLRNTVVLTEIASGNFIYTPFVAAHAGADSVISIAGGLAERELEAVVSYGTSLANYWGYANKVLISRQISPELIEKADIVTNLAAVRPINESFIKSMKQGSVVPYMRESWEYRAGDVDLEACQARNIPVMGTNESHNGLDIFGYCGPLAAKLLFEAGVEVKESRIVVLSDDRFGERIAPYLDDMGAYVELVITPQRISLGNHKRLDALIVATFSSSESIIGENGWIESAELAKRHPECTVIQLVGKVDANSLAEYGIRCIPEDPAGPRRMSKTFGDLGAKPVIELHTAGLKVGELMWHKFRELGNARLVEESLPLEEGLCQVIGLNGSEESQ